MLVNIIIFQLISIVVCAEEKCHLVGNDPRDDLEEPYITIMCDVGIKFRLEYRQKPYNEPNKMHVMCYKC